MGDKRQRQAFLNLFPAEEPEGHQRSVDVEEQEEAEVIHEKQVQQHGNCNQDGHKNGQILFMYSPGWEGPMGEQAAVQLIVLEIVRDPQPQKEAEHGKAADQLLQSQPEIPDARIQQDDKMDFPEDDQSKGKSGQDWVHFLEID